MHIWDTAGHERFRTMVNMYYRDTIGAVICYDISSAQSFKQVHYWINEMKKNKSADEDFIMVMAGNKSDLPADYV